MDIKSWLFCASALIFCTEPSAREFDFKGIKLGQQSTPENIETNLGIKCGEGFNRTLVCNGNTTLAGQPCDMNLFADQNNIVTRITATFDSSAFELIMEALSKKFGKPTTKIASVVETGFGVKHKQIDAAWVGKNGTRIDFSRFGASTQSSFLYLSTPAERSTHKRNAKMSDI